MATRSRIGILHEDGTVDSIYCHSDGYPEYNGKILHGHYRSPAKVKELISLGDISSLGEELEAKDPTNHTFDSREEGVTIPYSLKGKICPPRSDDSLEGFLVSHEEYSYVYDLVEPIPRWRCFDHHKEEWVDLSKVKGL